MSDTFTIDIPALPGFTRAMTAAPQRLDKEMNVAGRRIGFAAQALAGRYVPRWQGHLAGSIYSKVSGGNGVVIAFGASANYALPVEKGRRPGAPMPPSGALLPWMAAHGIPDSAEFIVRKRIGERGIPARPFIGKAHKELLARHFYLDEFRAAIHRTLASLT